MADLGHLTWPFLEERHRRLGEQLASWAARIEDVWDRSDDVDGTCRVLVKELGDAGWLSIAAPDDGDGPPRFDVRSLCVARETLARHGGLADFAFAMQGLGAGPVAHGACRDRDERRRRSDIETLPPMPKPLARDPPPPSERDLALARCARSP